MAGEIPRCARDDNVVTIREAIQWATPALADAGVDSPGADAEILLAHILGIERGRLFVDRDRDIGPDRAVEYRALIDRRSRREPLPYIVGTAEFIGLTLEVTPATLIPRPETELLVEWVAEIVGAATTAAPVIADVGTGSGAIAIALAVIIERATIYATDLSPDALAVAARNVARHRLGDRVTLLRGDLLSPLDGLGLRGKVDAVVANLPYVARSDFAGLQREVSDAEPRTALDGGEDGLDVMRRLVAQAPGYLNEAGPGILALEVGIGQADAVRALMAAAGLTRVEVMRDYADIERVVIGRRGAAAEAEA